MDWGVLCRQTTKEILGHFSSNSQQMKSHKIFQSYSHECTDSNQVYSPVPNIKKQASFRKRILSNKLSTNNNSLENGHRSTQNFGQNTGNASLPESPGLAPGLKARTEKEHTIQF